MKKLSGWFLLTVCLVLLSAVQVLAEETTTLSGTSEVKEDKVNLSVDVSRGGATSGQFTVSYDAEYVEVLTAEPGTSLDGQIVSINTGSQDGSVITVGFASASEEIKAGDMLQVEFQLLKDIPEGGLKFQISFSEWDGVKQSQTSYDVPVNRETGGGTGSVIPEEKPSEPEETPSEPEETPSEPEETPSGEVSTDASSVSATNTGDNAPFAAVVWLVLASAVCFTGFAAKSK